ncbi:phospholipid hydroperoxide glutathione peroxidase, chloroplastic [Tribonema minus]|uniref:Glutathione peroxidase n=1 Tax=Tribonema minus TaxID=303371 RepID=A0A835Z059_9STRA|nr:phospholipid hydroperoxide glutathione peroxidase, chloroplastic [Tribonema minus]
MRLGRGLAVLLAATTLVPLVRGFAPTPHTQLSRSASAAASPRAMSFMLCGLKNILGLGGGDTKGQTIFDFTVKDASGKDVPLSTYQGKAKAFVIVNLYSKYKSRGLEILGFPCNSFGNQEPGTNAEIQAFAANKGAKYPIYAKIEVNGEAAHPLYKFLKASSGELLGSEIKWNFAKASALLSTLSAMCCFMSQFLVDANGVVVKRYAPPQSPLTLSADIEALLNKA